METLLTPRKAAEQSPNFSAYIYCGQTAGQIRTPLGTEVGFSPGDTVLDGDPAPAERGAAAPPTFWQMSTVAKRLDGSGYHLVRR